MSLTTEDLAQIRVIVVDSINEALETLVLPRLDALERRMDRLERVQEEHTRILNEHSRILDEHSTRLREHDAQFALIHKRLDDIDGRLQAVEADIKELYKLVRPQGRLLVSTGRYRRLSPQKKIVILDAAVTQLAAEMGVTLPA